MRRYIALMLALLLAACAGSERMGQVEAPAPSPSLALLPAPTLPPVADYGACRVQVQQLAEAGMSYLTGDLGQADEKVTSGHRRRITFNKWYFRRTDNLSFVVDDADCALADIGGLCSPLGPRCPAISR